MLIIHLLALIHVHGGPKKWGHRLMTITLSNLNRFFKKITARFLGKFAVKWILKIPPHIILNCPAIRCAGWAKKSWATDS